MLPIMDMIPQYTSPCVREIQGYFPMCGAKKDEIPEIEITPEMIQAGRQEWLDWHDRDDCSSENLVRKVYLAMRALEGSANLREA